MLKNKNRGNRAKFVIDLKPYIENRQTANLNYNEEPWTLIPKKPEP